MVYNWLQFHFIIHLTVIKYVHSFFYQNSYIELWSSVFLSRQDLFIVSYYKSGTNGNGNSLWFKRYKSYLFYIWFVSVHMWYFSYTFWGYSLRYKFKMYVHCLDVFVAVEVYHFLMYSVHVLHYEIFLQHNHCVTIAE